MKKRDPKKTLTPCATDGMLQLTQDRKRVRCGNKTHIPWPQWVGSFTLFALLGGAGQGLRAQDVDLDEIKRQRSERHEVRQSLVEGVRSIVDLQIRDHKGKHSPVYDSCSTGDGCASVFPFYDPRVTLGLPTPHFWPKIQNFPNEWGSAIHTLTQVVRMPQGQAPVAVPDSNMFVTSSILYPLIFVEQAQEGSLGRVAQEALETIEFYKRNGAYSFWREHPSLTEGHQVVGPVNFPMKTVQDIVQLLGPLVGNLPQNPHDQPDGHGPDIRPGWAQAIGNRQINPIGLESVFNIPSDADDTALAMVAKKTFGNPSAEEIDDLVSILLAHRDRDRMFEDRRDRWKGKNTGAFLTWLKDESLPIAEGFNPRTGTIPFGVNNVDCVVNANVVFALGLTGYGDHPAVDDALHALHRAVVVEAWPLCGLYYPHKMMLPYTLTRAYRDGGLTHETKHDTLERILVRLLADQREVAARDPRRAGAFSGGVDRTDDLATALAVNALMNIGREIPAARGILEDYEKAINQGILFLVRNRKTMKVQFPANAGPMYRPGARAAVWDPGVFFSASVQEAAQWRSTAYTAAIVTEALAKYLLAWDYKDTGIRDHQYMFEKVSLD